MQEESKKLEIVHIAISELKILENHPKKMTVDEEEKITESIRRFSIIDPIILNGSEDRKNIVVGGVQRLKILKKLGYAEVPAVYVYLNEEQEKELVLRLSKNVGSWDLDILKTFQTELLLDVGFSADDLGEIWNDVMTVEDDLYDESKELEKIKETSIKLGDIFELGRHRLICSDSGNKENIEKLMNGGKASVVYTDPIFNIGLSYNKGLGGKSHYGGQTNDKKSDAEYREFLKKIFSNALKFSKPDLHFFSYCDSRYVGLLQELYKELGIKNKRILIWVKNGLNITANVAFSKMYESVAYGTIGKPYLAPIKNLGEILNSEIGVGNRAIEDILDQIDIWLEKRVPGNQYLHPTQKPVTLHERPIRRCSKVDDIILDLFAGSGGLIIACEQLKRRAFLSEIEPLFCQLIINRFEEFTGQKAKLIN